MLEKQPEVGQYVIRVINHHEFTRGKPYIVEYSSRQISGQVVKNNQGIGFAIRKEFWPRWAIVDPKDISNNLFKSVLKTKEEPW